MINLKSTYDDEPEKILSISRGLKQRQTNDAILKTTYPIYLYKPPFGYPRNINVVFLRELATNPYVFSVIKAITDQASETKWDIVPKKGINVDTKISDLKIDYMNVDEFNSMKIRSSNYMDRNDNFVEIKTLKDAQKFITEFFKNPNSDYESFGQLLRKVIPDILVLDSGVFQKIYNKAGQLLQLRVIDGGAILKNPDRFGSLYYRKDIISSDGYFGIQANSRSELGGKSWKTRHPTYKLALDTYNSYGYVEDAGYFQFAYGVNYSIPIPYGKKEIIYLMENPATESVYSRYSALQSAVDVVLNLIYSSKASLDLFLNANIPSGIIQLAGATQQDVDNFKENLYNQQYSGYDEYGIQRKITGKLPIVGNPNATFVPLNLSNKESQLIEIQQWFTKILWSCFGVTASEMGFVEQSNRATDVSQTKVSVRRAVKPRLMMIENTFNDQILPELPYGELFEFKFDYPDVQDEKHKYEIYEKEIALGLKSPNMIARQEGINIGELEADKEKMTQDEIAKEVAISNATATAGSSNNPNTPASASKRGGEKKYDVRTGTPGNYQYRYTDHRQTIDTGSRVQEEGLAGETRANVKSFPKKTATEIVIDDYSEKFDRMVKDIIKNA